jgi:hypothetical protein
MKHQTFPRQPEGVSRATPWHRTAAAKAAIAAVVLANEQPTRHRQSYALTTDEWYSYDGPLAAKVKALWTQAFEAADRARLDGDRDALGRWARTPKPDAVLDAAFAKRGL